MTTKPAKRKDRKAAKSYYGGEITERQKRAHEKKLEAILDAAEHAPELTQIMAHYRAFVSYSGKQREPFVTGSHKADQRFLAALGHGGEAGEVVNIVKKLMFRVKVGGRKLSAVDRRKLILELGDDFWYFMLNLIAFDISFEEVVMDNMRKLVNRGR